MKHSHSCVAASHDPAFLVVLVSNMLSIIEGVLEPIDSPATTDLVPFTDNERYIVVHDVVVKQHQSLSVSTYIEEH